MAVRCCTLQLRPICVARLHDTKPSRHTKYHPENNIFQQIVNDGKWRGSEATSLEMLHFLEATMTDCCPLLVCPTQSLKVGSLQSISGLSPAGLNYETPIWRARFPYLFSLGTGWPRYTPGHWVLCPSPLMTHRFRVELFYHASIDVLLVIIFHSADHT
jgi:hypothetical protein